MSNPKEKAEQLFGKFYELPVNHATAKDCALICVDEIIKALDHFGYAGAFYDNYETGLLESTTDSNPDDYWDNVTTEINKL